MNHKIINIVAIILFICMVLLPPILHGYVYPNNGDDTAHQVSYIMDIINGDAQDNFLYLGQNIVGYPVIWISNITGLSLITIYTWINYIALIFVGISMWLLFRRINWIIGLVAMFSITLSPMILNIYDTGAIYDLITVGIIYPLFVLSLATCNRKLKLIPVIILAALAIGLHTIGIFMHESLESNIIISYIPLIIIAITVITGIVLYIRRRSITKEQYRIIGILGITVILLSILAIININGWSYRIMFDTLAVTTMYIISLSVLLLRDKIGGRTKKYNLVMSILIIINMVYAIPTMCQYAQYNSAVKQVDIDAFEYVNSLDGEYFSCSKEVAPWLYKCYLNKKYKECEFPFVGRSEPMTPATIPNTRYYWAKELKIPDVRNKNIEVFSDKEIAVIVFN